MKQLEQHENFSLQRRRGWRNIYGKMMLAIPTGCATSFTSTAIRFESILHRFSVREKEKVSEPLCVDKREY